MKKLLLTIILLFIGAACCAQQVSRFYDLIVKKPVNKSGKVEDYIKTDSGVMVIPASFKPNKKLWKKFGAQVDSLCIINYECDTVYLFEYPRELVPQSPHSFIITGQDEVSVGYGSVRRLAGKVWPFYYENFHPLLTEPVSKWDTERLKELIMEYGSKPGEVEGPMWESVKRFIIQDHKLIQRDVIYFDAILFLKLNIYNRMDY